MSSIIINFDLSTYGKKKKNLEVAYYKTLNHSSEAPFLKREHVKEESAPLFALFAVQGKDDSFSPTLNTPISSRNVLGMLENETYIKSDVMRGDNNQLVELTISCFFFHR